MRRAIVTLLVLLSFGLKAQVYQAMPQAGYGPVKRMLFDSVLTIPLNINQLRNITGGRDAGQIRYNVTDSGLYVFSGFQWIKANLDSTNISNRINGKLNISDTAAMLLPYMKFIDTVSLSNRINLRVKYSDTAAMLLPYLRKLDTASLSRRIDEKQNIIKLTTNFKSGAATLIRDTLNIPKYSDTLSDAYVPYVGANKDVDLGVYDLTGTFLTANAGVEIQDNGAGIGDKVGYTSLYTSNEAFNFRTSRLLPNNLTKSRQATFLYPVEGDGYLTTFNYNLPVRTGTLALVEDTVNLSNRINLKADKATTLTINGVTYNLSANRSWTIPVFDSTSISNRIDLKLNISDTASMLSPYLRKADTSSLSDRIDLRVKYSDTASMLSPYLRKADTSSLSNRIDLRVKYSDTAAMLSPYLKSAVTSVGLSMPSAFTVTNSPVTSTGTLTVTGAGNTSQYIDGTGALQTMQGIVTEVETLVKEVYNETGATLTKGTVVYINGGHGNLPTVTKAAASSDSLSAQTFGLVKADISDNSNGYVIVIGDLIDMPTNSYLEGTQLYLSPTAGLFTSTKQYAPSHLVYVGVVTRSHPTQGVISVKIQNGYEMDELHNVSAQNPSNNSILQYKTSTNLWTKVDGTTSNIAEGTNLYYTDARVSNKMNYTDTVSLSNRINAKADALSGTTNTVPKFTSSTTIGNSNIKDDGNTVSVSTTAGSNGALQVGNYNGNILMNTTNTNAGLIFKNTSSSNKLWDISSFNNDLNFNESNISPTVMTLKAGGNVVISNLSGTGSRMVVADANGVLSTQAITGVDTTSLSNRINLKLNISDTASMLSGYQSAINSKQAAITLTTLNTSGAATFTSNTLNIPQYQAAGTYVTSVTGTSPIVSSGGTTPAISIPAASSSVNGYLSSTDWTTFNNKSNTNGTVTSVAALTLGTSGTDLSSTVANGSTTPVITLNVPTASASNRGALSSSDWTTFNNKASTAALSGYLPLTGGTLTNTLTTTGATNPLIIKGTNASTEWTEYYYNTSTLAGYIGNGSGILSGAANSDFIVRSESDFVVATGGNSRRLTIASTGAATFSSSVTAQTNLGFINTNSSQAGFVADYTGTGALKVSFSTYNDVMNIYNETNGYSIMNFTRSSKNLVINPSGGNVGIGTTSPSSLLHLQSSASGGQNLRIQTSIAAGRNYMQFANGSGDMGFFGYGGADGKFYIYNQLNDDMIFGNNSTERMRITSGGDLLVGATTTPGAGSATEGVSLISSGAITAQRAAATVGFFGRSVNDGELFAFYRGTTQVGNISVTTSLTSYNVTSDYRLKQDFKEYDGLSLINKIKTYDYQWKIDKTRMYGVVAHELQEVIPYAVQGVKDGEQMQSVDYSKLVPVMVKAIQEQQAQIKDLQTEIQTLKNK